MRRVIINLLVLICCAMAFPAFSQEEDVVAGPAYAKFPLTLSEGTRKEIGGPVYYSQEIESQRQWCFPPLWCRTKTPDVDWDEMEILYPVLSYRRFGAEYQWQFVYLFTISGGKAGIETNNAKRTTIFPFYFKQRSSDTNLNYTAVMPFYGHLENRMFRDDIKFIMFPAYSETRKKDVVTDNYFYPFYDVRRGNHLTGWQIWPFYGVEHRAPCQQTNVLDELETVPGYDKDFIGWPIYFNNHTGLGTTNVETSLTVVPFYSHTQSLRREQISYGWPIGYDILHDQDKGYQEHDFFWPLFVFAHGTKQTTRIFPFYSASHNRSSNGSFAGLFGTPLGGATNANVAPAIPTDLESDFYLWPVYKYNRVRVPALERQRMRIMFFLYSDTKEKRLETGESSRLIDCWPFYRYRRGIDGNRRWQVMALLEPFFPNNRSIERDGSQLWSFWRWEKNPRTHASSRSLLWNLYRSDVRPESKKISLFFGLFQYQSGVEGRRWRVCYVTVKKKPAHTGASN